MSLRVLFMNVFYPPQAIGGATYICSDLVEYLSSPESDVEPVVLTTDAYSREPAPVFRETSRGYPIYRVVSPLGDSDLSNPDMAAILQEVVRSERIDLVSVHAAQRFGLEAFEFLRNSRVPYVITLHDGWWVRNHMFFMDDRGEGVEVGSPEQDRWPATPGHLATLAESERLAATRHILADAKALVAVSDRFADVLTAHGLGHVVVIENGLPPMSRQRQSKWPEGTGPVVGFFAGEAEHKGYWEFRGAIERLEGFRGRILVTSDSLPPGGKRLEYWGRVAVELIGAVDRASLHSLLPGVDVVFAPSLIPESYGILAREALGCGCRVVVPNSGGLGELIGLRGVIECPAKAEYLSDVLLAIQGDADSRVQVGADSNPEFRTIAEMADAYRGLFWEARNL